MQVLGLTIFRYESTPTNLPLLQNLAQHLQFRILQQDIQICEDIYIYI